MANYDFWEAMLSASPAPDIDKVIPQPGFYKAKTTQDGDWFAVAIWYDADQCITSTTEKTIDPFSVWPRCGQYPIAEYDYHYFSEHKKFPDNNPPSDEALIEDQINDKKNKAEAWLSKNKSIKTQEQADIAAQFQQELSTLAKSVDKVRAAEKKPHWDAGVAVDAKYKKIVAIPTKIIKSLKAALTPFLILAEKKIEDARREELQAAADKVAAADKILKKKKGKPRTEKEEIAINEAEDAVKAAARPQKKAGVGGATGRKVSLRKRTVGLIVDYDKALIAVKDYPETKELVQTLCNRAANDDQPLDGMKITIEEGAV